MIDRILKSKSLLILIALIFSTLAGLVVSNLLLGKPMPYRDNMFWKYTVFLNASLLVFTICFYIDKVLPIIPNLIKFVSLIFFMSIPYFIILVILKPLPISYILEIVPAQIILLAAGFIWHVATEIDKDLEKKFFMLLL
ncbi:MAG TPA: hypothetical protein DCK76_05500 [Desulfotomaculum sp.]|nr:MAG: hypothetical protein XD75_0289 [Parcubacteria bacterium 33_209]HAG10831.1 hypothetical protein [Desulfotomaculum sp.]HBY03696.1 hypothetical protein [Desulfotomaculum sp.]